MTTPDTSKLYADHLDGAMKMAEEQWGRGWTSLTQDMRNAFVCQALMGSLGLIDFEATFGDRVKTDLEIKLLGRLQALTAIMTAASRSEP